MNTQKSNRGGARSGAGRPAKPKTPEVADKNFAARILERIGKPGWRITDLEKVKNAEDYAIYYLSQGGAAGHLMFDKCVDRRDGQPVRNLNHMHDKPIEHNVVITLAETVEKARKRAASL